MWLDASELIKYLPKGTDPATFFLEKVVVVIVVVVVVVVVLVVGGGGWEYDSSVGSLWGVGDGVTVVAVGTFLAQW